MNDFKDHGIAVSHKVNSERLNLGGWVDYGQKIIDKISHRPGPHSQVLSHGGSVVLPNTIDNS